MIRAPRPRPESRRAAARRRLVTEEGDIYAAKSTDGLWMKIGFSQNVPERIQALNAEYKGHAEFVLVATVRSTFANEQKLHSAMQPLHQVHIGAGKEFYPVMPAVSQIVLKLIEWPQRLNIRGEFHLAFRQWCRAAAKRRQNILPAIQGHREIVEKMDQANARYFERIKARVEAREAQRAQA